MPLLSKAHSNGARKTAVGLSTTSQACESRRRRSGSVLIRQYVFSAKGAGSDQPGAPPQDLNRVMTKGRRRDSTLRFAVNPTPVGAGMNRAFSAKRTLCESLGRCPRLIMAPRLWR